MVASSDVSSRIVLVMGGKTKPPVDRQTALSLWQELYPGETLDVMMIRETGPLHSLVAKRAKIKSAIEHEAWAAPIGCFCSQEKRGEMGPKQTKKRDAMLAHERELDSKVEELLTKYKAPSNAVGRSYLVLFSSLRAANAAKQVVNTAENEMKVKPAPLYRDVRYEVLQPKRMALSVGLTNASRGIYLAMLFFYTIPIVAISPLLQLPQLEKNFPFVRDILDFLGDGVTAFVSSFLPTVALLIFFSLLPVICLKLAELEHWHSHSLVMNSAAQKNFFFTFIWGFVGLALVGSLLSAIDRSPIPQTLIKEGAHID